MARVAEIANAIGGPELEDLLIELGYWDLLLGRFKAAEVSFRNLRNPWVEHQSLVQTALARGDARALRQQLDDWTRTPNTILEPAETMLLVRAGRWSDAAKWISIHEQHKYPDAVLKTLRGELALARGRTQEAIPLLKDGVEGVRDTAGRMYFLGSESLANALLRQGDLSAAITVLERAGQLKWLVVTFRPAGPLWIRNEILLAQFYRRAGREQDAQQVEATLRQLLAFADPDDPILAELKRPGE